MKINKLDINNAKEIKYFYNFVSKIHDHGHSDFTKDFFLFKESMINKNLIIFLSHSKNLIDNYFMIEQEKKINRTIIKSLDISRIFKYDEIINTIDFSNSVETGIRDSENSKILSNKKFKPTETYNFMELEKTNYKANKVDIDEKLFERKSFDIKTDLEKLTNLQNICFKNHHGYQENRPQDILREINYIKKDNKNNYIIGLINPKNEWVGYAWSYYNLEDKIGKLLMCGSLKNYRNHGLASSIVNFSINHLFELGCKKIRLEVDNNNSFAKKIYSKMGFNEYDNLKWYEVTK